MKNEFLIIRRLTLWFPICALVIDSISQAFIVAPKFYIPDDVWPYQYAYSPVLYCFAYVPCNLAVKLLLSHILSVPRRFDYTRFVCYLSIGHKILNFILTRNYANWYNFLALFLLPYYFIFPAKWFSLPLRSGLACSQVFSRCDKSFFLSYHWFVFGRFKNTIL